MAKVEYKRILVRLTLKRFIGDKGANTKLGKENLNYNIVNTIRGKYLRDLKRPNKNKIYNSNTVKVYCLYKHYIII